MDPQRLRIAVFSDSALPILNGVSVSIDALVQELREMGHSVVLFTSAHYGHRDSDPNTFRFFAMETPWTKGYPLAFPPFYPMLRRFRQQPIDVIHTHTPWTVGFVGLRWAESHAIPIVSTYHTLYDKYAHYIPFVPKRYLRYKIAKHTNYYYNRVDAVITPSESAKKWLVRHSVSAPIRVIPTGTRASIVGERAELRRRLGMPPGKRVMLYVGRIAKEKNMGVLFEAAAKVIASEPDAVFWLVGDGPWREACAAQARDLGIGDRVRFVGFVPRSDVDQYYAAADLFAFSSMTETQGLVVSEAMSHGLPAVVVQGGGAGASVRDGENGFMVRNDPAEFAQRVLDLFWDEGLYLRMADAARRSVRGYTSREMTEEVLEVYRNVLTPTKERGLVLA